MKRTEVRIDGYTAQEIEESFKRLEKAIEKLTPAPNDFHWMTRQEAAEMLKVTTRTLQNWSGVGILTAYSIGNRIYFRSDEVQSAMKPMNSRR